MKLPDIEDIIDLHARSIETFGGAVGLRDRGALEASLARAKHIITYAPEDADVVAIAGAVCASICRNHAFADGNKRIAFIALGIILELNDFYLDARESDASLTMINLAAGSLSEENFVAWVRSNTIAAEPDAKGELG